MKPAGWERSRGDPPTSGDTNDEQPLKEHDPMTRRNDRNIRRFQLESLEGRNAPSHFGAHAVVAHAVANSVQTTRHQEVQSLDRNHGSSNDSSRDTTSDPGKDTIGDPSKDVSSRS
jgi:hypothetical protein